MTGKAQVARVAGLLAAMALVACGGAGESTVTVTSTVTQSSGSNLQTTTPSSTSSSATPAANAIALVTTPSPPSGPPYAITITSVRPDGTHGAPVNASTLSTQLVTVAAGSVWFVDPTDHLERVRSDGSIETVALLDPKPADAAIAVSPDGSSWLWPVWTFSGSSVTSAVWVGGRSTAPRSAVSRSSDALKGPYLVPRSWTQAGGALVVEQPGGIGGRILYDDAIGQLDRLDVTAGTLTKVLDSTCLYSDIAPDGTIACAAVGGPRTFTLVHPDGRTTTVTVPGQGEFGNARFDAQGRLLAIGYEITNGADSSGTTMVSLDIVNLETGHHTTSSHAGLTPLAWSPGGSVVATDRFSSDAVEAGFLVDASGSATAIGNSGTVVAAGAVVAS